MHVWDGGEGAQRERVRFLGLLVTYQFKVWLFGCGLCRVPSIPRVDDFIFCKGLDSKYLRLCRTIWEIEDIMQVLM